MRLECKGVSYRDERRKRGGGERAEGMEYENQYSAGFAVIFTDVEFIPHILVLLHENRREELHL